MLKAENCKWTLTNDQKGEILHKQRQLKWMEDYNSFHNTLGLYTPHTLRLFTVALLSVLVTFKVWALIAKYTTQLHEWAIKRIYAFAITGIEICPPTVLKSPHYIIPQLED